MDPSDQLVALVLITGAYAYLTYVMARATRDAAAATKTAAEASLRSLDFVRAQAPVNFWARPHVSSFNGGPTLMIGVEVMCDGASVFVHSARLDGYSDRKGGTHSHLTDRRFPLLLEAGNSQWPSRYPPLNPPLNPPPEMPHLLHRGEFLYFEVPGTFDIKSDVSSIGVAVEYSFSVNGTTMLREVNGGLDPSDETRMRWRWPDIPTARTSSS